VIAAGAAIGIGAIYCYKNGVNFDTLVQRCETDYESYSNIVANLINLGKELLMKLIDIIKNLYRELLFKLKINIPSCV
jgi:hypothetical protein